MFTSISKMKLFSWLPQLLVCLALLGSPAQAQQPVLDQYIQEAFGSNQGLRQQQLNLEKAMYALREAKSYYMPNVGFNATYTRADGGRTIDLPIGDLLNPIYSTLNQLTATGNFPQIENQQVLLNPDNFYDAKLHTTLPLINMEIGYNKRIKQEAITAQQAAVNVYKRELVKDIKSAYYRYYQATQAIAIYESSLKLVAENVRVNESLLRNGARNATALTRSQAEQEQVSAARQEQEDLAKSAKAYFNFLLNRELSTAIILDTSNLAADALAQNTNGISGRDELTQLKAVQQMYAQSTGLQKSNAIPKLSAFLDLGSQAFNFNVSSKSMYYLGGISLQWDLFAGNRNNFKIRQASLETQAAQARYDEAESLFKLQEEQAKNKLNTALTNYKSALSQEALAIRYYNDQFKVYKEGQLLYIELIDAQNQLTGARLRLSLASADIRIAGAELERSQAAYPL